MAEQSRGQKGLRVPHLAMYRKRAALSQSELAERAHVSRATVIRGERGGSIRYAAVRQMAEVLGVSPEQLTQTPSKQDQEPDAHVFDVAEDDVA